MDLAIAALGLIGGEFSTYHLGSEVTYHLTRASVTGSGPSTTETGQGIVLKVS